MDNEVDTAAGSASADHSDAQKDEAQISQEPAPPFSRKAAKLTQELTTVEKLVEIAIKALALINNKGRQGLNPLGYHATERTLKTLQLIQENYDQVSQREFLLIVEEVVEFRSRELTKLFELTLQLRERDQIDKVISEIFSLC